MPTNIVTEYDTIAAISTPPGIGAISIVRLSGDEATQIANKIFKGKDLTKVPTHTMNYGHIIDPENGEIVDEVMVTVMRAPRTYTCEDIVEINTHGGIVVTNRVLELLLTNGARAAEPGEFTKRAFLNGRIDLTQAESIEDLIDAKSDRARKVAIDQLGGSLRREVRQLRDDIMDVMGKVEVNIDYPEYDEDQITLDLMKKTSIEVKKRIAKLLATAQDGAVLRDGLATALVGRPNVGKSSLLNQLLHQDKAIVTDVAGTTRDVLEEYVNVNGIPLKLIDTAGIRDTKDKVEKIGVERSRKAIVQADLVLLLIDASEPLTDEDRELIKATDDKDRIVILNKIDLPQKTTVADLSKLVDPDEILPISVLNNDGVDALKKRISDMFVQGIENSQNNLMITSVRQTALFKQASHSLDNVIASVDAGMPIDLVQIDFTNCWNELGEITGDSSPDEMVNELFSRFCLGK